MQIVIPMSGFGERFRRRGHRVPKPLIEVEGKPIIAHVVDLFPGETDFIFICSRAHLDEPSYRMRETLEALRPTSRIVGIEPHKLGPVHAVLQVQHLIDTARPVTVNYCDFACYWNWAHFKRFVAQCGCDGAIPAYRGFHPHSLGTTNYAYLREANGWVLDIQEKQPYTQDRMQEFASSGTYYFASGALMLDAFRAVVEQDLHVNGEYYVSLAYRPVLANHGAVAVYPLQHFMQWGTPEDVDEYDYWSRAFRRLVRTAAGRGIPRGSVVVPMAGLGQRFADEGYAVTKPLVPVSGRPMVLQATDDMPPAVRHAFVLRADMQGHEAIASQLREAYPDAVLRTIERVTDGQACTAVLGVDALDATGGAPGPLTIGACDNGALYDSVALDRLLDDPCADVLVWAIRGYPNAARTPRSYGWLATDGDTITGVSVKQPLADPASDPIVLGTFTFRLASDFRCCVDRLIARDARVNGEFYIDSCINDAIALGLRCRVFEVDAYLCWGTPNDLRTFEYWQSCFHKWASHPYRLELDAYVPSDQVPVLEARYARTRPELPRPRP